MKKILVTFASLAVALAASFGASAHPFKGDPTPPANPRTGVENNTVPSAGLASESDVDRDDEAGDMDEPQAGDVNESNNDANDSDDNDVDEENDVDEDEDDQDDEDGDQDEDDDDNDDEDEDEEDDD
jgi:hypothetical protein